MTQRSPEELAVCLMQLIDELEEKASEDLYGYASLLQVSGIKLKMLGASLQDLYVDDGTEAPKTLGDILGRTVSDLHKVHVG